MSEWKSRRLGDLIDIRGGLSYKSKYIDSGDAKLLGMGCVSFSQRFLLSGCRSYAGEYTRKYLVEEGDLVIATRQQSENLPILGFPAMIPSGMNGADIIVGTNLYKVDNQSNFTNSFLFWLMRGEGYRSHVKACASGSTVRMITKDVILDYCFACPSEKEAEAIATFLNRIEDKIELNQKMNQTLEEIAKAIFKSWFVDFDPVRAKAEGRPTGLPREISDLFPDELVDSEIGEIPKGWRTSSLLSLCKKIESGGTPSRKTSEYWDAGTISWFKTGEFCDSPLLKSEENITPLGLEKSAAKEWSPETILFAMYGATVGKMAYLTETGTANQAVAGISPDEHFGFAFVWQTLISGRSRLMSLANGAAQQNLNLGLVKDFTVITPSAELARTFSDMTDSIYQRITLLHKESDCLSTLRDTLLPKLISGELRIPDAEKFLEEAGI